MTKSALSKIVTNKIYRSKTKENKNKIHDNVGDDQDNASVIKSPPHNVSRNHEKLTKNTLRNISTQKSGGKQSKEAEIVRKTNTDDFGDFAVDDNGVADFNAFSNENFKLAKSRHDAEKQNEAKGKPTNSVNSYTEHTPERSTSRSRSSSISKDDSEEALSGLELKKCLAKCDEKYEGEPDSERELKIIHLKQKNNHTILQCVPINTHSEKERINTEWFDKTSSAKDTTQKYLGEDSKNQKYRNSLIKQLKNDSISHVTETITITTQIQGQSDNDNQIKVHGALKQHGEKNSDKIDKRIEKSDPKINENGEERGTDGETNLDCSQEQRKGKKKCKDRSYDDSHDRKRKRKSRCRSPGSRCDKNLDCNEERRKRKKKYRDSSYDDSHDRKRKRKSRDRSPRSRYEREKKKKRRDRSHDRRSPLRKHKSKRENEDKCGKKKT